MSDISLTAAQRSSLISLQQTQSLSDRTQTRLSTGKEVNSVVDDAVNFFRAKALTDRASDFNLRKDGIDQGISALNASLGATEAVDSLLKQLKGVLEAARSQSTEERQAANRQFVDIGEQIYELVEDSSYQGLNLLNNTSAKLEVAFGVRTSSELEIVGRNLVGTTAFTASSGNLFTSTGVFSASGGFNLSGVFTNGAGFTAMGSNNSAVSFAAAAISRLDTAISRLRATSAELGSNVAILQTRLDFTTSYVNELETGSDKLTLADLNEEGANLVALQTRQQLGIQSLAISGQQQQSILALLQ
jgi:flagellin-like hook-associated protein FlgL